MFRLFWRLKARLSELDELVQFRRLREGVMARPAGKRPKVFWSLVGVGEARLEQLQALASSAAHLKAMMDCPHCQGWKEVLEAKAYWQQAYEWQLRKCEATEQADRERFAAAREWAAVEGLFKELYRRIKAGEKAQAKLQTMVK